MSGGLIRHWATTDRGRRTLEELLDLGYRLDPPPVGGGARNFVPTDYITVADSALLDVNDSDSFILQVLTKLDAAAAVTRMIAGKIPGSGVLGYGLFMTDLEIPYFHVNDFTDTINRDGTTMTAGTWYAFTCVLKANSAANDDISLWQDFTENGPTNSTVMGSLANGDPFRVGADSGGGTPWDGDVAYCRFWKKTGAAWSNAEITQILQAQNRLVLPAGWGPGSMNLQWVLWDAGTPPTTTKDLSGNGLDGTYTAFSGVLVDDPKRVMGPGGSVLLKRGVAAAGGVGGRRMMLGYGV